MASQGQSNQDNNQNTGGYVGEIEAGLGADIGNATSSATGGKNSNIIFNSSSGSSFGLVKMLALAGVTLLAIKMLRK